MKSESTFRNIFSHIRITLFIAVGALLAAGLMTAYASSQDKGERLRAECLALIDNFDYKKLLQKSDELLNYGRQKGDERLQAWGYTYKGGAQLFYGDAKAAKETIDNGIRLAEKIKNDTILSSAYNTLGIYEASINRNLYLSQRYFLKSRQYARQCGYTRVEKSMGSNLAELAIELNDTSGFHYAQECYEYGIESAQPRFEFSGLLNLAELSKLKGDLDATMRYATMALSIGTKHGYKHIGHIYRIFAEVALERDNASEAVHYADLSIDEYAKENKLSLPKAYLISAQAYRRMGDNNKAISQLQNGVDAANQYNTKTDIDNIFKEMSEIYDEQNNQAFALKYLKMAKESSDSSYRDERTRLDNERTLILEMEDQENTMKLQEVRIAAQNRFIIMLAVVVFILVGGMIYIIMNQRKKNRLYLSLVKQNMKVADLRNETAVSESIRPAEPELEELPKDKAESSSDESNDTRAASKEINDEKGRALWTELRKLMQEERLYADPKITREAIIERLATNRTYLTQVISRYGAMNYSQFINSFRIDEAVSILSDPARKDYPLKQLSFDLGFGSVYTFYKVFNSITGMSPANFRKSAMSMHHP